MKSVTLPDKRITKEWIENIQDCKAEKIMEINHAIPMHFQFCEMFDTTLAIHIHCERELHLTTMIFASLKDLEVTGDLIQCHDAFEAQNFEEFPHQISVHQPNQLKGIWHFDVILPDVISNDKQASNENVRDKQTSDENVRDKQASNEQDNNKKKSQKKQSHIKTDLMDDLRVERNEVKEFEKKLRS